MILAPMEGLGNFAFRRAIATIGGFDEATQEFIRIPTNAHIESVCKAYRKNDTYPIPLAAQIMCASSTLTTEVASILHTMGAHRVELNAGCPSNTVTGKGAGSSLLLDPERLYKIASALAASSCPVTSVKIRSGYESTSLFEENLHALEESGISYIAIHPRTKKEGYSGFANRDLIRQAKAMISLPIIGNGDITSYESAKSMIEHTGCDGIMIGRAAVTNPFIFHEIRAKCSNKIYAPTKAQLSVFIDTFHKSIITLHKEKGKIALLKQLFRFLYLKNETIKDYSKPMLRASYDSTNHFLHLNMPTLLSFYFDS